MARSIDSISMVGLPAPWKLAAKPSGRSRWTSSPLSAAWTTTLMPASLARAQNGSNMGSPGVRLPRWVVTERRTHHDQAGPLVEGPRELGDGHVESARVEVGGGEDAILVG